MNVTVLGRSASYISDYTPTNTSWKIQLQDAHRLDTVAGTECFIKRFARRLPAWDFLVANRAQRYLGLPLIHDAQSVAEGGEVVYYLFLEKIDGELLHDVIRKGGTSDGHVLGRSIASALRVIHAQGYWHADFCTKNIMVTSADKQFVLIDIDSLEATSTFPCTSRNHPGYMPDQELAVYSLAYVSKYVQPATNRFAVFPGPALNFVQLIFLLNKLAYFAITLRPQGAKFGHKKQFEGLHEIVHEHLAPYTNKLIRDILAKRPVSDELLLSQDSNFQSQLQATRGPAAPTPVRSTVAVSNPEILSFTASVRKVLPGGFVILSWVTTNCTGLKLNFYPKGHNGLTYFEAFRPVLPGTGSIKITYDEIKRIGNGKRSCFELVATNTTASKSMLQYVCLEEPPIDLKTPLSTRYQGALPITSSAPARVPPPKPRPPTKTGFGKWVIGLGLLLALFGWYYTSRTVFEPNQQLGLELYDKEDYTSSFNHLVNFRDDTSHHYATQYDLAHMYDLGLGTEVNDTLAVNLYLECLRSAAPKVVSDASYFLGLSYLVGEGCTLDESKAKMYFAKAVNADNNPLAAQQLAKLNESAKMEAGSKPSKSIDKENEVDAVNTYPAVERVSDAANGMTIRQVTQLGQSTKIDFVFQERSPEGRHIYLEPRTSAEAMHLVCNGTTYALIKTKGIAHSDNITKASPGHPVYFSVYFERLPYDATSIDIIEGGPRGFCFYNVRLELDPN